MKIDDQCGTGEVESRRRKAWLQQLQVEFNDICFQYRVKLQLPILEMSAGRSCLGSWNDQLRVLSLSSHLIQTYPWFIVAFAGLHTLQEMTSDYWHPLFGSVTRIPVSFLSPGASKTPSRIRLPR